jgi:hypothetical protein
VTVTPVDLNRIEVDQVLVKIGLLTMQVETLLAAIAERDAEIANLSPTVDQPDPKP